MARDDRSFKRALPAAPPVRLVQGPRSLASLLPPITRPAFRSRSPAAVQLMTDWAALAGPQTAAIATPRRFSGGTLTLAASGPGALQLQHQAIELMARINGALGRPVVERLRFVQDAPADPQAAPTPRAPEPVPVRIDGLPEGSLHDALARLGGRIAARGRT